MSYRSFIQKTRLVTEIESNTTTGDVEYDGTALEIRDKDGKELFHVVLGEGEDLQALFFASAQDYRMPLDLLERIIARAREVVKRVDEE